MVGTEVMTAELEVVAYAPVTDALVADDDPTRRHDQLKITQTQTKAVIEPPACWMTSGGQGKPRYGFEDIVMPRRLPRPGSRCQPDIAMVIARRD